jgi:hypothetical protein
MNLKVRKAEAEEQAMERRLFNQQRGCEVHNWSPGVKDGRSSLVRTNFLEDHITVQVMCKMLTVLMVELAWHAWSRRLYTSYCHSTRP